MDNNLQAWEESLKEKFPDWNIHSNEKSTFIRIPDTVDFEVLKSTFPDMVVLLKPFLTPDQPRLEFIVSNSVEDYQYVLSNSEENLN